MTHSPQQPQAFFKQCLKAGFLTHLDTALACWCVEHGGDKYVAAAWALVNCATRFGHTCLPLQQEALDRIHTQIMLESSNQDLARPEAWTIFWDKYARIGAMRSALKKSELVANLPGADSRGTPLVLCGDALYLQRYWNYEQQVAQALGQLLRARPGAAATDEPKAGAAAKDLQSLAATKAIQYPLMLLLGGPGTGKTTTVAKMMRRLIEVARAAGDPPPRFALAAPTGKAADRLEISVAQYFQAHDSDIIPCYETFTLHRLLGLVPNSTRARDDAPRPLPYDVIIVDETSMVDLPLMAKLLNALNLQRSRLILVGDHAQLASVSSGSILQDLRPSDPRISLPWAENTVVLEKNYRSDHKSGIGLFASMVRQGDASFDPEHTPKEWAQVHLKLVPDGRADMSLLINEAISSMSRHFEKITKADHVHTALGMMDSQRLLCMTRKGDAGIEQLNQRISEKLAPGLGGSWYHGRPIMISANDYRLGLFNGDTGILWEDEKGFIKAWFRTQGQEVLADHSDQSLKLRYFLPHLLPAHETTYAMTVHKSQGSEYDQVWLLLPDHADHPLLTREMLYTAITRARKSITVAGLEQSFTKALRTPTDRYSGLRAQLIRLAQTGSPAIR